MKNLVGQKFSEQFAIVLQGLEDAGYNNYWKVLNAKDYGVNADGETQLYKCIQAHTSQADWTPDTVPALFKAVGFTDSGVSIWTQPLGATDAYMKGDVVSFENTIWVSTCDNNVWQPGVYGWEVQS